MRLQFAFEFYEKQNKNKTKRQKLLKKKTASSTFTTVSAIKQKFK
jgi:hypothetical protein